MQPSSYGDYVAIIPKDRSKKLLEESFIFNSCQSKAPLAEIEAISFGLMNPNVMRSLAADVITKSKINSKGKPPLGSVNSPALGATDNHSITQCCNAVKCRCTGPFGIVELAYPMYNPLFLDDYIIKILNCLCPWCAKLLIDDTNVKLQLKIQAGLRRKDRIPVIQKLVKSINVCSRDPKAQRRKRKSAKQSGGKPKRQGKEEDDEEEMDEQDDSEEMEEEDEHSDEDEDGGLEEERTDQELAAQEEIHAQLEHQKVERQALLDSGCCGGVQFRYFKRRLSIWRQAKVTSEDGEIVENKNELVTKATVLDIFKRMSDHDIDLLGLHTERGRPEFMLFEVFIIPGRLLRPVMNYQGGNQKSGDNPFTKKLQTIVKTNTEAVAARRKLIHQCRQSRGANGSTTAAIAAAIEWKEKKEDEQDTATNKTRSTVTAVMRANHARKLEEQQKLASLRRLEIDDESQKLHIMGNYRSGDPEIDDFTWEDYTQDDMELYQETNWLVEDLQYFINTYLSSADFPVPKNSKNNRSKASAGNKINVENKINGKAGMQRTFLLAKRNDFCARAVINPSPRLDVHELGVPLRIAKHVTIPDTISPLNIEKMRELIRAGPKSYPGAVYVQLSDEEEDYINLSYIDRIKFAENNLRDGMIVHRHIIDGDIIFFNRQPSLTKNSFMSHVVRVIPGHTFEMNPAACKAYNADFDGDQMVVHVPQTYGARVEGRRLVQIKFCLLTSQSSTPLVAPIQDTITACYQMTQHDILMPELEYRSCASAAAYLRPINVGRNYPALLVQRQKQPGVWRAYRTGRQLFSQLLPPNMTFIKDSAYLPRADPTTPSLENLPNFDKVHDSWFSRAEEQGLVIIGGRMVRGIISSKELGTSPNSMILYMVHNFGYEPTVRFESDVQRVSHEWLSDYGFSIGPEDMMLPMPEPVRELVDRVLKAINDHPVLKPAIDPHAKRLKADNPVVADAREQKVKDILNQLTNLMLVVSKEQVMYWNCLVQIIMAGAKGKEFNLVQVLTMLGQTVVAGKRISQREGDAGGMTSHTLKEGVSIAPEWLPFIQQNHLMAQGHIKSSFSSGLNPIEYYAHAKAGRQGIKTGALITADVGYLQRKMMYAMMNLLVENDLSVRDSAGNMLQMLYGKDGWDSEFLVRQVLGILSLNDQQLIHQHSSSHLIHDIMWPLEQRGDDQSLTNKEDLMELLCAEVYQLQQFRDTLRKIRLHHRSVKLNDMISIPMNIVDIVHDAMNRQAEGRLPASDIVLTPSLVVRRVMACKEQLYRYYPGFYNRLWTLEAAMHSVLCIKNVLCVYRLSYTALEHVLCELEYRFKRGIIDPKQLVGLVSAQNQGQVQLQTAMNSHSVVGVNNEAAGGFSYFQQSINTTEKPKDPQMRLATVSMRQVKEFMTDEEIEKHILRGAKLADTSDAEQQRCIADYICRLLVYRGLDYFLIGDAAMVETGLEDPDADWLDSTLALMDAEQLTHIRNKCPYSVRLVLDPQKCQNVQLSPAHILKAIKAHLRDPTTNDDDIIVRAKSDDNIIGLCSPTLRNATWVLRLFVSENVKYFGTFSKSKSIAGDKRKVVQLLGQHLKDKVRACGVAGISHANLVEEKYKKIDEQTGDVVTRKETIVATRGINMLQAVALPFVDGARSTGNCLRQVCSIWGIEVAANTLMRNLEKMIDAGDYVDSRHMLQLVKTMCHHGYIMPLQRNGINRIEDHGAIHKSNFERQVDNFCIAAAAGETDALSGLTERNMIGLKMKAGTGGVDVELIDTEPSDALVQSHRDYLAAQVLPVFTEMDCGIMLYNSGEQRVYPSERIDAEQLHHDMEKDIIRFCSIGCHALPPPTVPEAPIHTNSVDQAREQFWQEVLRKRKEYTDVLNTQIALHKCRKTRGRKRKPEEAPPASPKRSKKESQLSFRLVTRLYPRQAVRALDERDCAEMLLPTTFRCVSIVRNSR